MPPIFLQLFSNLSHGHSAAGGTQCSESVHSFNGGEKCAGKGQN